MFIMMIMVTIMIIIIIFSIFSIIIMIIVINYHHYCILLLILLAAALWKKTLCRSFRGKYRHTHVVTVVLTQALPTSKHVWSKNNAWMPNTLRGLVKFSLLGFEGQWQGWKSWSVRCAHLEFDGIWNGEITVSFLKKLETRWFIKQMATWNCGNGGWKECPSHPCVCNQKAFEALVIFFIDFFGIFFPFILRLAENSDVASLCEAASWDEVNWVHDLLDTNFKDLGDHLRSWEKGCHGVVAGVVLWAVEVEVCTYAIMGHPVWAQAWHKKRKIKHSNGQKLAWHLPFGEAYTLRTKTPQDSVSKAWTQIHLSDHLPSQCQICCNENQLVNLLQLTNHINSCQQL